MTPDTNFLYGTAKRGSYKTQLPMVQEAQFQQWVKQNRVPFDDGPQSDYDMRGFWQAAQQGKASTQVNPSDNQIHYPDTWKTPYHESFSRESKYATQNAPTWNGDDQRGFKLQDRVGNTLQDESLPRPYRDNAQVGTSPTGLPAPDPVERKLRLYKGVGEK